MRRLIVLLAAAATAVLVCAPSASANNDPHRIPFPSAPYDLPTGICDFAVHVDFPVNREYAREAVLEDGSWAYTITGSWVARVSRPGSDAAVELNVGGPGLVIFAPDWMSATEHLAGRTFLFATNLTDYGFPSNFVATAGPVSLDWDFSTMAFTRLSGHPQVITDVCAALS